MAGKSGRSVRLNITLVVELRSKKGWNQEQLSDKAGVSKRTIENAETGRPINLQTATKIATAFKVEVHVILLDEHRPNGAVEVEVDVSVSADPPPPPVPTLSAVDDFTGRVKERAEIARHLLSGTAVCITAIKAAGGMGKTQLARKSAEELAAQFPGGTLLLELDGITTPKSPVAVMQELIRTRIPGTGQLPDTVEPLRPQYLAAFGPAKLLLVLDNAADAAQVGPLLRDLPPTVGVIVTSRKLISLPTVKRIDLEVMSDADAVALLGGIVAATRPDLTPADLSAVAAMCGHLPLALRVAGTLLRDDKKWTRARFAKALAADPLRHLTLGTDEYDVGAVLRLSVHQLVRHNAEQAERFQMLGVFPATFALPAAAAVWGLGEDETFTDLDELHHRSLIEWDETTDRYRLHDLMRPVARAGFPDGHARHAGGADRLALAERRFAEHYAKVLKTANDGLLNVGLPIYDLEVANIAAGRAWADAHAVSDPQAAMDFLYYTLNGAKLYGFRLQPAERVALYEKCLLASITAKNLEAEAKAKTSLGDALATRGDIERSLTLYREAAKLNQLRGDVREEALTMGRIADILQARGQTDEALRIRREEELPVYERLGDEQARAVTMGQIADILQTQGQTDEALRIRREECLPVYERFGDVRARAVEVGFIADVLYIRGQTDEALRIRREECLPVYMRLGDLHSQLICRANICVMLMRKPERTRGEDNEAREHLLWALATAEKHQYVEAVQLREMVAELFGPSEP